MAACGLPPPSRTARPLPRRFAAPAGACRGARPRFLAAASCLLAFDSSLNSYWAKQSLCSNKDLLLGGAGAGGQREGTPLRRYAHAARADALRGIPQPPLSLALSVSHSYCSDSRSAVTLRTTTLSSPTALPPAGTSRATALITHQGESQPPASLATTPLCSRAPNLSPPRVACATSRSSCFRRPSVCPETAGPAAAPRDWPGCPRRRSPCQLPRCLAAENDALLPLPYRFPPSLVTMGNMCCTCVGEGRRRPADSVVVAPLGPARRLPLTAAPAATFAWFRGCPQTSRASRSSSSLASFLAWRTPDSTPSGGCCRVLGRRACRGMLWYPPPALPRLPPCRCCIGERVAGGLSLRIQQLDVR